MATATLRPNGAGDSTQMDPYPGSGEANWEDVDEETADDDATYVKCSVPVSGSQTETDLYALPGLSEPTTEISNVRVYFRMKGEDGNAWGAAALRTHGQTYYGSAEYSNGVYSLKYYDWATNPYTSAAWTDDEIDALQAGAKLTAVSLDGSRWCRCTQVYVVVTYTPAQPIDPDFIGSVETFYNPTLEQEWAIHPDFIASAESIYQPKIGLPSEPAVTVRIAFASNPLDASPSWTDVSSDFIAFKAKRGRQYQLDRIDAGSLTLLLKNTAGDYFPKNTLGSYYPNVKPGKKIQVRVAQSGITYDEFTGFIESWDPQWLEDGAMAPVVEVRASDGMKFLNAKEVNDSYSQELSGTRVGNVLDDIGWPAADRSIDTGQETIIASTLSGIAALDHIRSVEESELSLFYIDRSGKAVYEDRHHRTQSPHDTSQVTFRGVQNRAMYFPGGASDYISFGNDSSLDPGNSDLTFEFWLFRPSLHNNGYFSKSNYEPFLDSDGASNKLRFNWYDVDDAAHNTTTGNVLSLKTWEYIVITFEQGTVTIYVNNVQVAQETDVAKYMRSNAAGIFRLGYLVDGQRLLGLIDEFRYYKRVITALERSYNYNNGQGRYAPLSSDQLVLWNHFDEMAGNVLDHSGQGNNGTLSGDVVRREGKVTHDSPCRYSDIDFPLDEQLIYNIVKSTREGGSTQTAEDASSQTAYGPRSKTFTGLLLPNDLDAWAHGRYVLARYKDTQQRVRSITIWPDLNRPYLYDAVLAREISDRVTVVEGDSGIDEDYFIEGKEDSYDMREKKWETKLQLSDATWYHATPSGSQSETEYPDGAGDETNINYATGSPHWDQVNEESSSNYVANNNDHNNYQRDLYTLADPDFQKGVITNVRIRCYFGQGTGSPIQYPYGRICLKTGGTVYQGSEVQIDPGQGLWEWAYQDWATNPDTGQAWTWAEIVALQVGISLKAGYTGAAEIMAKCAVVQVIITFNAPDW